VPQDVNGSAMDTIIYNGRSYVPLRAIAEALGVAVDWEGSTSTIILGERGEDRGQNLYDYNGVNYLDRRKVSASSLMYKTVDPQRLTFQGGATPVTFDKGRIISLPYGLGDYNYLQIKTDKKYQRLYLKMFLRKTDGKTLDKAIGFHVKDQNDVILLTDSIQPGEIKEGIYDVGSLDTIYLQFGQSPSNTQVVIVDSYLR
jgi:hypothetical protein